MATTQKTPMTNGERTVFVDSPETEAAMRAKGYRGLDEAAPAAEPASKGKRAAKEVESV